MLRPYQEQAINAVFSAWEKHRSTLLVMPTGTGKTVVFADIIKRIQPKRALVLGHREEIIYQSARKIEERGVAVSLEMAEQWAPTSMWHQTPCVVSTVQTQCAGRNGHSRMMRFAPTDFDLIIADEAQHSTAKKTWRRVIDYYMTNPELKLLGCTATPDRADEEALGQVFESVAVDLEILDMIHDGWLVPVTQQFVVVEDLDYSHVRTTCGDLNGAELAEVMEREKPLQRIAAASIDIIGDRKTIVFTVTVKQAERMAEIFNRHRSGMAAYLYDKTPKAQRHETLARFRDGRTQVLVNVGIVSEGYDEPTVEVVAQARPTKSRSLYAQQIGRALRPLAGVVDGLSLASERKYAIAQSKKPSATIIDFTGNAGRHKLMSCADVLGGKLSDEVIALATARAKAADKPTRTDEEIAKAIAEIKENKLREAAKRVRLLAKATYRTREINPFDAFQMSVERIRNWDSGRKLSLKQHAIIVNMGLNPDDRTYAENCALIAERIRRWKGKLCTLRQANLLTRFEYDTKELTFERAKFLIDQLKRNGWRRPKDTTL